MQAYLTEEHEQDLSKSSMVVLGQEQADETRQPIRALNSLAVAKRPSARGENKPKNLAEVSDRIRGYEGGLQRVQSPLSDIRLDGNRMVVGEDELAFDGAGVIRLCNVVGAPATYLDRLPCDLRNRNLEYGLKEIGRRTKGLSDRNATVLSRDGRFVALDRGDLFSLSGPDVIDALRDGLGEAVAGLYVQNWRFKEDAFALDVVSTRNSIDVLNRGDVLQAGIHLQHSLLGEQATIVTAFIVRLQCTNGMTYRECLGSRQTRRTRRLESKREDARILQYEQVRSLVRTTQAKLNHQMAAIEMLARKELKKAGDVDTMFEQFLRRARLFSQPLMRLLRRVWADHRGGNGELTYFAVLNALTWVATHSAELPQDFREGMGDEKMQVTERQRTALAALAGVFAYQEVHICPHCFGALPSTQSRISDVHEA